MAELHFEHIKETCLYVSDLDQTQNFYHQKLGLPIVARIEGRHIFFRAGRSMLLCFIASASKQEDKLPPHYASGKQHMAFGIPQAAYQQWKEKIIALGIPITCEFEWRENLHSLYFDDPDQNVIEIVPNELWE